MADGLVYMGSLLFFFFSNKRGGWYVFLVSAGDSSTMEVKSPSPAVPEDNSVQEVNLMLIGIVLYTLCVYVCVYI